MEISTELMSTNSSNQILRTEVMEKTEAAKPKLATDNSGYNCDDAESPTNIVPVPSSQALESVSQCQADAVEDQKDTVEDEVEVGGSRGGFVNTPASFLTDFNEYKGG